MAHYTVNPSYITAYQEARDRLMDLTKNTNPIPMHTIERGALMDTAGDWRVVHKKGRRGDTTLEFTASSLDACLAYMATTEGDVGTRSIVLLKDDRDVTVVTERITG